MLLRSDVEQASLDVIAPLWGVADLDMPIRGWRISRSIKFTPDSIKRNTL